MDHTAPRFLTKFADRSDRVLWITHVGKVRISNGINLNNIILIPDLGCNLISVPWLLQSEYSVNSKSACTLGLTGGNIPTPALTTARYTNRLYALKASYHPPSSGSAYAARSVADQLTYWHHRLRSQQGSVRHRLEGCIYFDLGLCTM
jgi:hypothetical protein